jgi:spermidine synthase
MNNRVAKLVLLSIICFVPLVLQPPVFAFVSDFGQVVHEKNSLYTSIFVYQSGSVMTLQFGRRQGYAVESQVDLDNLRSHLLEYSEMTFSGLLYNSEPNNLLVLGLGGGVIPREMRHYFPSIKIDVAEIDRDILPIASKYFGFKPDENMKVHVTDGRVFVKKQLRLDPVPKYDIIVLDAFNGDYIPFHLMTKEFLEELKGVLSDDGVVVANVFYTNELFDAEFKTFLDVFGRCQVYYGDDSGNAMIVSPASGRPVLTAPEAMQKAAEIQDKLKLSFDFVRVARLLAPEAQPRPQAQTLTDDRAPVNWLRERQTETDTNR